MHFLTLILPDLMANVAKIYQIGAIYAVLNTHNLLIIIIIIMIIVVIMIIIMIMIMIMIIIIMMTLFQFQYIHNLLMIP